MMMVSLTYLQRAWYSAWNIPSVWYITVIFTIIFIIRPLVTDRAKETSEKWWEHLLMACCGVAFPLCAFLSWVDSSFSEDSRAVLRPFHILQDSSWEMLGKIYFLLSYPLIAKGTPLMLLNQGEDWETFLDLSLQLRNHKFFSPSSPQSWKRRHPGKEKGTQSVLSIGLDLRSIHVRRSCVWLTRA